MTMRFKKKEYKTYYCGNYIILRCVGTEEVSGHYIANGHMNIYSFKSLSGKPHEMFRTNVSFLTCLLPNQFDKIL